MSFLYILQRAEHGGTGSSELLQQLQLAPDFVETSSSNQLSDALPRVIETASRLTKNDFFGFEAGKCLHPCLLGAPGLAATHAPSMAEMLDTLGRFSSLSAKWCDFESTSRGAQTAWSLNLFSSCSNIAAVQIADAWGAGLIAFGRLCSGDRFRPKSVELQRNAPSERSSFDDYFGCEVQFGATENKIVVRTNLLTAKSRLSDPLLFEQLIFAASAVQTQLDSSSILDAVDQAIRRGLFDLQEVSEELGVSGRSIQRKLRNQKTTFQQRLDAVRSEIAETYLRLPSLTVEQIAQRLGFSNDKAFRTAYRRWTGRAPRDIE